MECNIDVEQSETEVPDSFEVILSKFMEIPANNTDESTKKLQTLLHRLIDNNYKLCTTAEIFKIKAEKARQLNEGDPNIEVLKNCLPELEVLKKTYLMIREQTANLRSRVEMCKLKRAKKRFFVKNDAYYKNCREKFFPEMIKDSEKMEKIIDEFKINSRFNISETEFEKLDENFELANQEIQNQENSEETLEALRKDIIEIESETCRIEVLNNEYEEIIRTDDYKINDEITELKNKIKTLNESIKKKSSDKKSSKEFKNPNDYPNLLDFLDSNHKKNKKKEEQVIKDKSTNRRKQAEPKKHSSKRKRSEKSPCSKQNKHQSKPESNTPQKNVLKNKNADDIYKGTYVSRGLKENNQRCSSTSKNLNQAFDDTSNISKRKLTLRKFSQPKIAESDAASPLHRIPKETKNTATSLCHSVINDKSKTSQPIENQVVLDKFCSKENVAQTKDPVDPNGVENKRSSSRRSKSKKSKKSQKNENRKKLIKQIDTEAMNIDAIAEEAMVVDENLPNPIVMNLQQDSAVTDENVVMKDLSNDKNETANPIPVESNISNSMEVDQENNEMVQSAENHEVTEMEQGNNNCGDVFDNSNSNHSREDLFNISASSSFEKLINFSPKTSSNSLLNDSFEKLLGVNQGDNNENCGDKDTDFVDMFDFGNNNDNNNFFGNISNEGTADDFF